MKRRSYNEAERQWQEATAAQNKLNLMLMKQLYGSPEADVGMDPDGDAARAYAAEQSPPDEGEDCSDLG